MADEAKKAAQDVCWLKKVGVVYGKWWVYGGR